MKSKQSSGKKNTTPKEHMEQVSFVNWFRATYPTVVIFAIPNGGIRHAATAIKLQLEGVLPGVPDLYIPAWRVWVEMKRSKGGSVSQEQKDMAEYLESVGYTVLLAKGYEDGKEKILRYRQKVFDNH